MRNRTLIALLLASGCVDGAQKPAGLGTGALLSMDYFGGSDVVGFHYEIERVACDASDAFSPLTIEENVDLVDGIFPGQIELVEQVYDETSRHLGADLFTTLPAGCYDVTAAPASAIDGDDWTPSTDCSVASADGLEVVDGQTTETTLISQCVGDEFGALDTLVTLNHPPVVSIDFPTEDRNGDGVANGDDGKFNYECEPVEVCATIYDEDDDPIEVDWTISPASGVFASSEGTLQVIGFENGHRVWEQCVEYVTRVTDTYDVNFTAWDLGYSGGSLVRIESLVAPESSRDDMDFPIHTNWAEEPLCYDADGDLVPAVGVDIHREAGCDYVTAEEWYCSGAYAVDPDVAEYVCEGTNLIEENLYPNCDGDNGGGPGTPPEVPCNGRDDDSDGTIDEGSVTTNVRSYSGGAGGSAGAGAIQSVSARYAEYDKSFTYTAVIRGSSANGFAAIVNNGGAPTGTNRDAEFYMDCGSGSPKVTVYGYNAYNMYTAHSDGSSAGGTQTPDRVASSINDPDFLRAASCTFDGTNTTMTFTVDATDINGHVGIHSGVAWDDPIIGSNIGIWFYPVAGATFTYSGGWVSTLTVPAYGGYDVHSAATTTTTECH